MVGKALHLIDMGERRLISEVLAPRYHSAAWRFGDDVAVVMDTRDFPDGRIVATVDPAPPPVAWHLAEEPYDFYYYGWLTAALNLSDLAAAGAEPVALMTSFVLPNEMDLKDFNRLLDGVDDCCATVGTRVKGGNLKEGAQIHCEATAVGVVSGGEPMSRQGAKEGDVLCAVGNTGRFWAGMLAFETPRLTLTNAESVRLHDALLKPRPLIQAGKMLRETGIATSCTDNSDGLYGSLWCLAQGSGLGMLIDEGVMELDPLVEKVSRARGVDPVRLVFGFGDLQLICTISPERVDAATQALRHKGIGLTRLGVVTADPGFFLRTGGRTRRLVNLDNERFTVASQFTGGLEAYRKRLLEEPLTTE